MPDRQVRDKVKIPAAHGPVASAIIGAWTLRHYVDIAAGVPVFQPFGLQPEGLLIYTADGYMSALLMASGRQRFSGNGLREGSPYEYVEAGKTFIGYSGTYEVDEARSVVTHTPHVAFAPNMVGNAQERAVKIDDDFLILTTRHPHDDGSAQTESRLEWLRVKTGREET
jgi:hypothetical protein